MSKRVDDERNEAVAHSVNNEASEFSKLSLEQLVKRLVAEPTLLPGEDDILHLVEEEFPRENAQPTAHDVDDAVNRDNTTMGLPFATGQWVERFGNDMKWHLEPIRRTVRVSNCKATEANSTDNWSFFYKTSAGILCKSSDVRAPQEGLARCFGMRPFLWQQWALYKIERFVRFQTNHERDFEAVDYMQSANILFEEWLNHENNKDFKALYYSKPLHVQEKLKSHVFSPFKLMNEIVHEDDSWNMEDAGASVYQYNSFLGSGWITSILVLFVQLVVPLLLLMFQIRGSVRFPAYNNRIATSYDFVGLFETDWETFCNSSVPLDALIMNVVIFIVYSIRVVPIVFDSFYSTVGDAPSLNSRLNSLRTIIWEQGDDTVWQQLGFKLDRYMNSVYIALVNALMLIILFLTDSTIDVILNALAIDFLYNFDRDIPTTSWYDPGYRYLKASIVELVIRGGVLLEIAENPAVLCKQYDVDPAKYWEKVRGPLLDLKLARKDDDDPEFMATKDKIWIASARVAKTLHRTEALWQFSEQIATFGAVDTIVHELFTSQTGIFNRFKACYTWSRWQNVLFLPDVPSLGQISTFKGIPSVLQSELCKSLEQPSRINGSSLNSASLFVSDTNSKKLAKIELWNYDPSSTWRGATRFLYMLSRSLRLRTMKESLAVVVRRKLVHHIPFRFIDGIIEWTSFIFLLFIFPLWLCFYVYLVIGCQPLESFDYANI